ncbi:unnamed protein product [Hymenolepis diminuta]|uniref:Protein kinase domain-containing protein n=1 Tax=Hymenolepis diminuta TaxID=6216 RepID=A0A0R3SBF1_HYMDI|nr:unnamed protein product [Hymenolepis diminuta]
MTLSDVLRLPKTLWKEFPLSSHDPAKWFSAFNKVEEIVKSSNYPDPDNCLLTLYEYALEHNAPKNTRLMISLVFYFDALNRLTDCENVIERAKECALNEFRLTAIEKVAELLSNGFSLRVFLGLYYYLPKRSGEWIESMRRYDETHKPIPEDYVKTLEPYLETFRKEDENLLASIGDFTMRMFKRQAGILPPPSLQGIAETETEEEEDLTLLFKSCQVENQRLPCIEESTVQMESVMTIEEDDISCGVMSPQQITIIPEEKEDEVKEMERTKETDLPKVTRKRPFWSFKETVLPFRGVREDEIDKENTYETLLKPNRTSEQEKSAPLTQKTIVPIVLPAAATAIKEEENVKIERPSPMKIKKSANSRPPPPPPSLPTINNSDRGDTTKDPISLLIEQSNAIVGGEKFLLLRRIGRGGFSNVYCVMNHDRQMRAIKRIELSHDSKEALPLFQNEINLLTSLRDTNRVINLFKYEITRSELVMVLEYAEQDLKSHLKMRRESGALSDQFMVFIWSEMLACVKVIHDRRIIHLDLKPENFVIVNGMLKLIDLGISQRLPVDCTHMDLQKPMGSLVYMSPEQLISVLKGQSPEAVPGQESKMRLKTDVWALGAILFEIVHGKSLFGRINQTAIIAAIISPTAINFYPVENPILDMSLKRSLVREVDKRATVDELICICSTMPTSDSSKGRYSHR